MDSKTPSLLTRMLLGMVRPTAGSALIEGHDVTAGRPDAWKWVECLVETPFAYPELTARENFRAAALLHGVERARIDAEVGKAIEELDLGPWADRRSRVLTLGDEQRLGLACAVVRHLSILVLSTNPPKPSNRPASCS